MHQEDCRIGKSCENIFRGVLSHKSLTLHAKAASDTLFLARREGPRERTAADKLLPGSSYVLGVLLGTGAPNMRTSFCLLCKSP